MELEEAIKRLKQIYERGQNINNNTVLTTLDLHYIKIILNELERLQEKDNYYEDIQEAYNYLAKNQNKDVTNKYINMIEAFECDFELAKRGNSNIDLCYLQDKLDNNDSELIKDIELLEELSFNLRYNKLKIVEVEENDTKI